MPCHDVRRLFPEAPFPFPHSARGRPGPVRWAAHARPETREQTCSNLQNSPERELRLSCSSTWEIPRMSLQSIQKPTASSRMTRKTQPQRLAINESGRLPLETPTKEIQQ